MAYAVAVSLPLYLLTEWLGFDGGPVPLFPTIPVVVLAWRTERRLWALPAGIAAAAVVDLAVSQVAPGVVAMVAAVVAGGYAAAVAGQTPQTFR